MAILLVLVFSTVVLDQFLEYLEPLPMNMWDWLDIPISIGALIGLYGFSYQRRIGQGKFWQNWFYGIILWDILFIFYLSESPFELESETEGLIFLALAIPWYIALYLYGFRSDNLWKSQNVSQGLPG